MPIATLTNVRFGHGTRLLLDGAVLSIEPGEKIGLVGRNGCGKSTLMRLLAGQAKPDAGSVGLQRGCRVGFLTQDPTIEPTDTLREAAARAFTRLSIPSVLRVPLKASVTLLEATTPVKLPSMQCLRLRQIRFQIVKGWYFNNDSTVPSGTAS